MPTAPVECTEPLWIRVYGLPVTNGVEEQKRPSFQKKKDDCPHEARKGVKED